MNTYKWVKAPPEYPGKRYAWGDRILKHHLVWWRHTGEVPGAGEIIHHRNENKADNRFRNLKKETRAAHTVRHHLKEAPKVLTCAWCGGAFSRSARYVRGRERRGQRTYACSRSCAVRAQQRRLKEGL